MFIGQLRGFLLSRRPKTTGPVRKSKRIDRVSPTRPDADPPRCSIRTHNNRLKKSDRSLALCNTLMLCKRSTVCVLPLPPFSLGGTDWTLFWLRNLHTDGDSLPYTRTYARRDMYRYVGMRHVNI